MENVNYSRELHRYLSLLRHWIWLLALVTILAGVTAFLVSKHTPPVYQAITTLLIDEAPRERYNEYNALLASERLARTYSEMLTKGPVLEEVIESLELDTSTAELADAVVVQLVRDTQLIEVRAEDTDPIRAAAIANALVDVFARQNQALQAMRFEASKASLEDQINQLDAKIQETAATLESLGEDPAMKAERSRLETDLALYRQTYTSLLQSYEELRVSGALSISNVAQVEPAVAPDRPVRPRVWLNTALAAGAGLLLAIGAVFLIELLDDSIKSPDEVNHLVGLPVLGLIGRISEVADAPIAASEPRSLAAEAFRSLRTNIQFASVDRPLQSLLITSPTPKDGKSTVAANLAVVMAHSGRRVILMDADMRRPSLHSILGSRIARG